MAGSRSPILPEVFFGTVYGAGASAAIWTLARASWGDPWAVALAGIGAVASLRGVRLPGLGRLSPACAFVSAAYLAHGFGAAMLCSALATLVSLSCNLTESRRGGWEGLAYGLGSRCLAVASGALGAGTLGGSGGEAGALVGFVIGYAWTRLLLDGLAGFVDPAYAVSGFRRTFGRAVVLYLLGGLGGLALASAWSHTPVRGWLLVCLFVVVALRPVLDLVRSQRAEAEDIAPGLEAAVHAVSLACAARDPASARRAESVRRLSVEMGRRFDLPAPRLQCLDWAARLQDAETLLDRETAAPSPFARRHPGVQVVESLRLPAPVSRILKSRGESWDGRGSSPSPHRDEPPLESRILAAATSFHTWSRGEGGARRALDRLHQRSGQRFDPVVIKVLSDVICSKAATTRSRPAKARERMPAPVTHGSLELEALYTIRSVAQAAVQDDERWTLVADKLAALVPHSTFVLYRALPDGAGLRSIFARGVDATRFTGLELNDRSVSIVAYEQQRTTRSCPLTPDAPLPDVAPAPGLDAIISAPLVRGGSALGTVTLYDDAASRDFDARDRRLLLTAAGYIAGGLRGFDHEPPRWQRYTDALTGLPNADFLRFEISRHSRTEAFGLLAFQVGGIARLIERSGMEAAEQLLVAVARGFATQARPDEIVTRYGLDLFLYLTPRARPDQLAQRGTELSRAIGELPSGSGDALETLRVRAAHAVFPEDGSTLDALLERVGSRMMWAQRGWGAILPFGRVRSA